MAQRCYRYMDACRYGLSPKLAEYAVIKYTSHRCIPSTVAQALDDEELISMLAAEKLAASEVAAAVAVQGAAEAAVAVAHAIAHPLHADMPEGKVPCFHCVHSGKRCGFYSPYSILPFQHHI